MSRILSIDESNANGIQRLFLWYARRQYGYVPGIMKILLPVLRIAIPIDWLYRYLHLRKGSQLTRLQREMLATVVNGAVGGAP